MHLNGAHWHLLVNHFPIIGGLLATGVLGYGLLRPNESIVQLSLSLLVLMSVATLVTNQTGEQAEHYLESINDLNRSLLHQHEQAANLANAGMYLTGALSLLSLVWQRARKSRPLASLIFMVALMTAGLMINAGRLGGLIRHQELRSEPTAAGLPAN